ncbi:MAG: helix-turn-helix transcriptional regulator [Clostridia bacterium]|nr:helix-turn-helix transcriptional regulator [Clostridia bacterium]
MDTQNVAIGKRIRALREKYNLSREALAAKSEISVQFLYDIETGKKGMTVTTLSKLATALKVSTDEIVFGKNDSSIIVSQEDIKALDKDKLERLSDIVNMIIDITK